MLFRELIQLFAFCAVSFTATLSEDVQLWDASLQESNNEPNSKQDTKILENIETASPVDKKDNSDSVNLLLDPGSSNIKMMSSNLPCTIQVQSANSYTIPNKSKPCNKEEINCYNKNYRFSKKSSAKSRLKSNKNNNDVSSPDIREAKKNSSSYKDKDLDGTVVQNLVDTHKSNKILKDDANKYTKAKTFNDEDIVHLLSVIRKNINLTEPELKKIELYSCNKNIYENTLGSTAVERLIHILEEQNNLLKDLLLQIFQYVKGKASSESNTQTMHLILDVINFKNNSADSQLNQVPVKCSDENNGKVVSCVEATLADDSSLLKVNVNENKVNSDTLPGYSLSENILENNDAHSNHVPCPYSVLDIPNQVSSSYEYQPSKTLWYSACGRLRQDEVTPQMTNNDDLSTKDNIKTSSKSSNHMEICTPLYSYETHTKAPLNRNYKGYVNSPVVEPYTNFYRTYTDPKPAVSSCPYYDLHYKYI